MAETTKPTSKQLRELRRLANATGTTFTPPRTRREASRAISALRGRRRSARIERAIERDDVVRSVRQGTLASAPRRDEIRGYGSTARWAHGGEA
jgi:hypothetical protein